MTVADLVVVNFGAVMAPMAALWVVSLRTRDVSTVDMFWGVGFVLVAWLTVWRADAGGARALLIAGAVTLWGVRLAGYLTWRNWGHGEDRRYRAIRANWGNPFWVTSLGIVFGLQAALICAVSLPVQVAIAADAAAVGPVHIAGLAVFGIGLACETVGDIQLARFKADPDNRGKVLDTGLWRYTRHPNYFGDFMVWWGLFLLSWLDLAHAWTVIGPAVMTLFLLRVSGVTLLEQDIAQRRPAYADYTARTSAFIPWPPRA